MVDCMRWDAWDCMKRALWGARDYFARLVRTWCLTNCHSFQNSFQESSQYPPQVQKWPGLSFRYFLVYCSSHSVQGCKWLWCSAVNANKEHVYWLALWNKGGPPYWAVNPVSCTPVWRLSVFTTQFLFTSILIFLWIRKAIKQIIVAKPLLWEK